MLFSCSLIHHIILHLALSLFVSMYRSESIVSCLCDLFSIIIFIYFIINRVFSLKQTQLLFYIFFSQKLSLRVFPSIWLFCCWLQPGLVYKSFPDKKASNKTFIENSWCFYLNKVYRINLKMKVAFCDFDGSNFMS